MFVGRESELRMLQSELDTVRNQARLDRGVAVMIRGRRRVGKSRLAAEFAAKTGLPYVHFQAARGAPLARELASLQQAVARSALPNARLAQNLTPATLTDALGFIGSLVPDDQPTVVVLDELPWLLESTPGGAGELQRAWDLELSRKPILLLLLGSDISMMERLTRPDQPFHGRATEMVLRELNPADIARMTGLAGIDAFDAYLITGGQPLVAQEWERGVPRDDFLRSSVERATSALLVNGMRVLDGEFAEGSLARQVLTAIGGRGERTFTAIHRAIGTPQSPHPHTLTSVLRNLIDRRVVAADEPLSTRQATKDRRYRIADPGLRFWLAFIEGVLPDVDAGRPDIALDQIQSGFATWRGRAIEPVVRDAILRLRLDRWPQTRQIGGWWPRSNNPEIDLVGADQRPAKKINFVGTIKWRENNPLTRRDVERLRDDATNVPGAADDVGTIGVCPVGAEPGLLLDLVLTADELLAAWSLGPPTGSP